MLTVLVKNQRNSFPFAKRRIWLSRFIETYNLFHIRILPSGGFLYISYFFRPKAPQNSCRPRLFSRCIVLFYKNKIILTLKMYKMYNDFCNHMCSFCPSHVPFTELLTTLVRNRRVLRSCPDNETHRNNREGSKIYGWDYPCKSW